MIHPQHAAVLAAIAVILLVAVALPKPAPGGVPQQDGYNATVLAARGKLQVDFYGESLCPDCQRLVLNVLKPAFESGVLSLAHVRYIALGNVRGSPDDKAGISCQHGPSECLHNRYINCAQQAHPDQDKWFPYVQCLAEEMHQVADKRDACAERAGMDAAALQECAEGAAGAALEQAAYEETFALRPKHTYVPWVVAGGVPLGGAFEDLDRIICVAADPDARPPACYDAAKLRPMRG